MTTKEFKFRSTYFRLLDIACSIIFGQNDPILTLTCWHVQIFDKKGLKYETFTDSLFDPSFGFVFLNPINYYIIESFSPEDFQVQFKYFIGFYNRLSEFQKESLKSSGLCNHLLAIYGDPK